MEVVGNMFGIVRFVIWVQTWVIPGCGCGGWMGGGGPMDLADHCWVLDEVHLVSLWTIDDIMTSPCVDTEIWIW